jgi:hypothetical protein
MGRSKVGGLSEWGDPGSKGLPSLDRESSIQIPRHQVPENFHQASNERLPAKKLRS